MYTLKHFNSFRCCCFSAASLLHSALAGYSLTAHTFHNLNSFFQRFIITWPLVVAVSFCYFCSSCFFFSQHMHPADSPHTNTYNNLIYFHWYYYTLYFIFFVKGAGAAKCNFSFSIDFFFHSHSFFHFACGVNAWRTLSHLWYNLQAIFSLCFSLAQMHFLFSIIYVSVFIIKNISSALHSHAATAVNQL